MTAEIFVQMALKAWDIQISRTTKFFNGLSDEELLKEIAPGKNTTLYLMGHLIAVNDNMISLFSLGDRQYALYDEPFVKSADKSGHTFPVPSILRDDWRKSNETLNKYFAGMSANEWFGKHTAMTDEDLLKDPGRNKLSVLINRTNHAAYHLGQLILAK
ncbi:MAG: DinB family protein [Agriterribacter sp.]